MDHTKGLPSLRSIRSELGLSMADTADKSGLSQDFIRFLETGHRDCSQEAQRQIASALCCTPADLLSPPDTQRLLQIRAAYLRRQADEAQRSAEQADQGAA